MPAAQGVEKVDSQKAAGNGSGKQPQQVGSVDLSNRSGHQQEAESHLQNGFDRHDELEGKEEGQQRDAQQRPSETRKGPEEKGKQHDGLGSQQGWIHGIAGRRRPNGVSTGSPPPISGKSPARRCRSGCERSQSRRHQVAGLEPFSTPARSCAGGKTTSFILTTKSYRRFRRPCLRYNSPLCGYR